MSTKYSEIFAANEVLAAGDDDIIIIAIVDPGSPTGFTTKAIKKSNLITGGGVDTLYSADGTVGAGRIATITDSLTFQSGDVIIKGLTAPNLFKVTENTNKVSVTGGDFDVDGNTFFVDSSTAFVGLRTNGPSGAENIRLRNNVRMDSGWLDWSNGSASVNWTNAGIATFVFNAGASTNGKNFSVLNDSDGEFFTITSAGGEGRVGIGQPTPITSAKLEITSTTAAFRVTPMTAAQASLIASAEALMLFVSTTDATFTSVGYWAFEDGAWSKL